MTPAIPHDPDTFVATLANGARVVTVRIPAGVHEGQAVRIAGEGEPGEQGAPAGDLHCYIAVKPHPIFSRHNNDLVCQFPISFTQAALGATVEVPTLKGKEELEVPAGATVVAMYGQGNTKGRAGFVATPITTKSPTLATGSSRPAFRGRTTWVALYLVASAATASRRIASPRSLSRRIGIKRPAVLLSFAAASARAPSIMPRCA